MKGRIDRFFWNTGYGFIDAEDGNRYFCHISKIDIPEGQYPRDGQKVTFELEDRYKGKEATNVKLV